MKKQAFVLFGGLLAGGIAGYFLFSNRLLRLVFAHLGGLGIMGFLGLATGAIAASKGYGFKRAFLLGFALPILLGIFAASVVHFSGGQGCGGIVSLAAAFLVILLYCCAKNKNAGGQGS